MSFTYRIVSSAMTETQLVPVGIKTINVKANTESISYYPREQIYVTISYIEGVFEPASVILNLDGAGGILENVGDFIPVFLSGFSSSYELLILTINPYS